ASVRGQHRCERPAHDQRSQHVGLDLAARARESVIGEHRGAGGDAGVVDHERDVGRQGSGRGDVLSRGDVELHRHHSRNRDRAGVPGAAVDLGRTVLDQQTGEGLAEASVGAGHKGDGALDVHASPPSAGAAPAGRATFATRSWPVAISRPASSTISTCQSCKVRPCWIGHAVTSTRPTVTGRRKFVLLFTPTAYCPCWAANAEAPRLAADSTAVVYTPPWTIPQGWWCDSSRSM